MPSPLPGMDPFIESQRWADFHTSIITALRDALVPGVRPKYTVDVEERVYVERDPDDPVMAIRPDAAVVDTGRAVSCGSGKMATAVAPVECMIPMPEEVREVYLTIRRKDGRKIVTVIEVLSPANKRPGANGFAQYLEKRDKVLASSASLVELDLLRGGRRMPLVGKLPPADYRAAVSRSCRRPRAEAYLWSLHQPLPILPIPLVEPDADVPLDLQAIFNQVYDRAGYDYSLNYTLALEPPLEAKRAKWIADILQSAGLKSQE